MTPTPPPIARVGRLAAGLALAAAGGTAACSGGDAGAAAGQPAAASARTAAEASPGPGDRWGGEAVDTALALPSLALTDTRGRSHRLRREALGGVTLLFLGYTHCPDVCPVQMANLGAVLDDLAPSVRRHLRVVFVTVDPARDSAARIRSWLDRFGEGFVGLRGDEAQLRALQDSLQLPRATRQALRVQGRYTVGHAAPVLAFGPDARARRAYPSGTRQRDWRRDLPRLVRELVDGGGD